MFKIKEEKIFTVVKFKRLAYLISNREMYIYITREVNHFIVTTPVKYFFLNQFSAVKRLIASKISFCLQNICVCMMFI